MQSLVLLHLTKNKFIAPRKILGAIVFGAINKDRRMGEEVLDGFSL